MPPKPPIVRVYIEPNGTVASLCVVVQLSQGPAITWEWEVPYLLWNHWGTAITASWLGEQFRRHDYPTFEAVGTHVLVQALKHGLQRHRRLEQIEWLRKCPA